MIWFHAVPCPEASPGRDRRPPPRLPPIPGGALLLAGFMRFRPAAMPHTARGNRKVAF